MEDSEDSEEMEEVVVEGDVEDAVEGISFLNNKENILLNRRGHFLSLMFLSLPPYSSI